MIAFLGLTLVTFWYLRRTRAPMEVLQRLGVLLAVSVAQGAIGYIQYFNGIPALLVGFHIAGRDRGVGGDGELLPRAVRAPRGGGHAGGRPPAGRAPRGQARAGVNVVACPMQVHLVDGTYELFRHYFALPEHLIRRASTSAPFAASWARCSGCSRTARPTSASPPTT